LTHRLPQSVGLYDLIRDELSYYSRETSRRETVEWRHAVRCLNLSL
jgi:hypothetical protein